jgi:hypothetical protein
VEHPDIDRPHTHPITATNVRLWESDMDDSVIEESKDEEDATSASSRIPSSEGPLSISHILVLSSFT